MTTLTHKAVAYRQPANGSPNGLVRYVRNSRSLASMLPSFLSSGVLTLVVTGVMIVTWDAHGDAWLRVWMESWLTAWPIAFPVAYLLTPLMTKVAGHEVATSELSLPGLGCSDIDDISARVTAQNGLTVLRGLKPAHDFSGV